MAAEVDSCSATAVQWLSVDYGATSAFPAGLGERWVPVGTSVRRPDASGGNP